ncbi:MAG: hypothetical protein COA91_12580 [Robiginitomaculum sp.]|nr:MAG: hypothetical protein COA91_12580 [Robiginitomaculum sp.]
MARYCVKYREDGRGPYRWGHVVKTHTGFRQGSIYRQLGDNLTKGEGQKLTQICSREGFDLRRSL